MRATWLGGFIRENEDGEPIYVIRKRVDGHQYEVSTRCHTERAALKQLERQQFPINKAGAIVTVCVSLVVTTAAFVVAILGRKDENQDIDGI